MNSTNSVITLPAKMFENINIECVTVFRVCAACQTPCAVSQHSTYVVRLYSDFMTLSTDYIM